MTGQLRSAKLRPAFADPLPMPASARPGHPSPPRRGDLGVHISTDRPRTLEVARITHHAARSKHIHPHTHPPGRVDEHLIGIVGSAAHPGEREGPDRVELVTIGGHLGPVLDEPQRVRVIAVDGRSSRDNPMNLRTRQTPLSRQLDRRPALVEILAADEPVTIIGAAHRPSLTPQQTPSPHATRHTPRHTRQPKPQANKGYLLGPPRKPLKVHQGGIPRHPLSPLGAASDFAGNRAKSSSHLR
jgi:hypothetical protein